jgi:hypothetical protein
MGVVEVETGESVNHLEAMSQWRDFARLRAPFHLYVPANMIDVARRLCVDMQIPVAEIWTFHPVGDQIRFTMVHRSGAAPSEREREKPARRAAEVAKSPEPARDAARTPRRATPAAPSRRKGAATPAARGRSTATKAAPARGRSSAAKKKAAPSRSARAQRRK